MSSWLSSFQLNLKALGSAGFLNCVALFPWRVKLCRREPHKGPVEIPLLYQARLNVRVACGLLAIGATPWLLFLTAHSIYTLVQEPCQALCERPCKGCVMLLPKLRLETLLELRAQPFRLGLVKTTTWVCLIYSCEEKATHEPSDLLPSAPVASCQSHCIPEGALGMLSPEDFWVLVSSSFFTSLERPLEHGTHICSQRSEQL